MVRLTHYPASISAAEQPTSELGQHTDGVLSELGYEAAAIADLRERHVV